MTAPWLSQVVMGSLVHPCIMSDPSPLAGEGRVGGALTDVPAFATAGGASPVLGPPSPPSPARGEGDCLPRLGPIDVTLIDVTKD